MCPDEASCTGDQNILAAVLVSPSSDHCFKQGSDYYKCTMAAKVQMIQRKRKACAAGSLKCKNE